MYRKRSCWWPFVVNPSWREADQLAICKCSWEIELGATENNISWAVERDLNPRPADFKSVALTTRPRYVLITSQNKFSTQYLVFYRPSLHFKVKCLAAGNYFTIVVSIPPRIYDKKWQSNTEGQGLVWLWWRIWRRAVCQGKCILLSVVRDWKAR